MIAIIKIISAISLFIFSQGILKSETADRHPVLIKIVAGIAIIGTLALFYDGLRSTVSIIRAAFEPEILGEQGDESEPLRLKPTLQPKNPVTLGESRSQKEVAAKSSTFAQTFYVPDFILSFEISPSGNLTALQTYGSDETQLSIWDLRTGRLSTQLSKSKYGHTKLYWGSDDTSLFAIEAKTTDGQNVVEFNVATKERRTVVRSEFGVESLALNNGKAVGIVYTGEEYPSKITDGVTEQKITFRPPIWSPYLIDNFGYFKKRAPELSEQRSNAQERVSNCADGDMRRHHYDVLKDRLVFVGNKGCILIWKLSLWEPYRMIDLNLQRTISTIDLSADGAFLGIGTRSGDVVVVDLENSVILRDFAAEADAVSTLRFSNDNSVVYTSDGGDRNINRRSLLSGKQGPLVVAATKQGTANFRLAPSGNAVYVPAQTVQRLPNT